MYILTSIESCGNNLFDFYHGIYLFVVYRYIRRITVPPNIEISGNCYNCLASGSICWGLEVFNVQQKMKMLVKKLKRRKTVFKKCYEELRSSEMDRSSDGVNNSSDHI